MNELIKFLRDRFDEDYETAYGGAPSPWKVATWQADPYGADVHDRHGDLTAVSYYGGTTGHIERFDPTRVLAEVQAKRAIVDLHTPEEFHDAPGEFFCRHDQRTAGIWPCQTVKLLALPYADHPEYQEAWRP